MFMGAMAAGGAGAAGGMMGGAGAAGGAGGFWQKLMEMYGQQGGGGGGGGGGMGGGMGGMIGGMMDPGAGSKARTAEMDAMLQGLASRRSGQVAPGAAGVSEGGNASTPPLGYGPLPGPMAPPGQPGTPGGPTPGAPVTTTPPNQAGGNNAGMALAARRMLMESSRGSGAMGRGFSPIGMMGGR